MDIDSSTSSAGVISQFKLVSAGSVAAFRASKPYKALSGSAKTAVDKAVTDAAGGDEQACSELFAWCLFNVPKIALEYNMGSGQTFIKLLLMKQLLQINQI